MKRSSHMQSAQAGQKGFTLTELMITLAVAGIVAAIAAPNMRDFMLNSRLTGTANEFVRTLQSARSEAIKRQRNIVVCMSDNPTAATPTCATSGFSTWIVFEDINNDWDHGSTETLLTTQPYESSKITLSGDQGLRVSFAATGFTNPSDTAATMVPMTGIVICDARGNKGATNSTARGINIRPATGRPNITRVKTEIQGLFSSVDTLCPP